MEQEEFGRYLYQLRIRMNYTLEEAAGQMQIHKSTLCRYEQGKIRRMSEHVRSAFCELYGITGEQLDQRFLPEVQGLRRKRPGAAVLLPVYNLPAVREEPLPMTEEQIISLYRTLNRRQQMRIRFLLQQGVSHST